MSPAEDDHQLANHVEKQEYARKCSAKGNDCLTAMKSSKNAPNIAFTKQTVDPSLIMSSHLKQHYVESGISCDLAAPPQFCKYKSYISINLSDVL